MKKIIFTVAAIFAIGFVNAQEKEDMSFGVKGGLNISSITNSDVDGMDSNSMVGVHIGLFGEFKIADKFAIQPELLYSTQGVKLEESGFDADLKVDYINIPVMAKYYVAKDFSLEFGPQIGFVASAKIKSGGESVSIKDDVKSIDLSLGFGAAYNITDKFMVGARYNLGLTRLQKELEPGESDSKNSVFQISVGYKF